MEIAKSCFCTEQLVAPDYTDFSKSLNKRKPRRNLSPMRTNRHWWGNQSRDRAGPKNKTLCIHSFEHRQHVAQYLLITSKLNDTRPLPLARALYSLSLKRERKNLKTMQSLWTDGSWCLIAEWPLRSGGSYNPTGDYHHRLGWSICLECVMQPKLNTIYAALT